MNFSFVDNASIQVVLDKAVATLQNSSTLQSDSVKLDAEILLSHALDKPRSYLISWPEKALDAATQENFAALLQRRITGEPIAYILGEREFWSLNFQVTPETLIPRPETETLVETVLNHAPVDKDAALSVVDLGTGSGCIAIALAKEKPHWQLTAIDIAQTTLDVAIANAKRHQVSNISFLHSHWFDNIPAMQFDMVVSNPPYIREHDEHLTQGDVRFEPQRALTAGIDGLDCIRTLAKQAFQRLKPGGKLLMEIGYDQADAVCTLLENLDYQQIAFVKDDYQHDRICIAQR